jgi:hypothetical protein
MEKYKVFFHFGEELTVKTKVAKGQVWIDEKGLHLTSNTETFTISEISTVELFRLHGTMRVIRVDFSKGRLFLSVVRFMIGQFAFVNFLKTGNLKDRIAELIQQHAKTQ